MSQALIGRLAIKAKQIRPGEVFAAEIRQGQLVEITDMEGKQVAQFAAFALHDPRERLSPAMSRMENGSIMVQEGMKLYSNRGTELFELIEDTVGRHDLLAGWGLPAEEFESAAGGTALADAASGNSAPVQEAAETPADVGSGLATASPEETAEGHAPTEDSSDVEQDRDDEPALAAATTANGTDPEQTSTGSGAELSGASVIGAALAPWGLTADDLPDPVNWFMYQAILQRGELEVREPLSERGDHIVLRALSDTIVVVRASDHSGVVNGDQPSDLMVRVFR